MVKIIINPPCKVLREGSSFMINQTQIGPIIVSNKKKRLTSSAGMYLGAIVTKTKGIATHMIHINGTIKMSLSTSLNVSTKKKAKIATKSFPIRAAGTRLRFFCKSNDHSIKG